MIIGNIDIFHTDVSNTLEKVLLISLMDINQNYAFELLPQWNDMHLVIN